MSVYWRRVHDRALRETYATLGLESRERALIAIILAAVAIAAIWTFGGKDAALGEVVVKMSTTAAILLAFPIVYLWKFMAAPARLQQEAEAKLTELAAKISLRLELTRAIRDPNSPEGGPVEFYLDFVLWNEGTPTVVTGWHLQVRNPPGEIVADIAPRDVSSGVVVPNVWGVGVAREDLSQDPLPTGARREGRLFFRVSVAMCNAFLTAGTRFTVTVQDVRGSKASAVYTGPVTSP